MVGIQRLYNGSCTMVDVQVYIGSCPMVDVEMVHVQWLYNGSPWLTESRIIVKVSKLRHGQLLGEV